MSHNTVLTFAYALTFASRGKSKIALLDWGGGIGHYYLISRAVLPPDVQVLYTCKDVPILCEYGRKLFPEAVFYDDDGYLNHRYDFALVSGSLQYAVDWKATLQQIIRVTDGYVLVTRLPIVHTSESFVVLQRAYQTEYLGWVFNREEFLQCASEIGLLRLIREFIISGPIEAHRAPERFEQRGFLFQVVRIDDSLGV